MCGIAGFIQRRRDPEVLDAMLRRLAHRGPDGEGRWLQADRGWQIHLGHRRLSIIDLEGGAQPMVVADRGAISFNGEIYNYRALGQQLQRRGEVLQSSSDTEVLLRGLLVHGRRSLTELDGMFAFASVDLRRGELLLGRDRAGVKPLYYAPLPDGGVAFASELAALLAHPALRARVDPQALVDYLFGDAVPPPRSLVAGVAKLPPASVLGWRDGRLGRVRRFWRPPTVDRDQRWSARRVLQQLREQLDGALQRLLVADVPVGVLLSGGLDSSAVALHAARQAGEQLRAYSVGFARADFDESGLAAAVAGRLGLDHRVEQLDDAAALGAVEQALACLDEPLADHSVVPTWLLARLAAREVKVVLSGDGADELWGGYPTYLAHRVSGAYGQLPALLRRGIGRASLKLPSTDRYQGLEWQLQRFAGRWEDDPVRRHLRWMASVDLPLLPELFPAARDLEPSALRLADQGGGDALRRVMAVDFHGYLTDSVLTKVDRMAMAHGLEVRPAFLQNELMELAFRVPLRFKFAGRVGKQPLRAALRGQIPDAVLDRPKHGFSIPLAAWTRGPLRGALDALLADSPLWQRGGLDRAALLRRYQAHQARQLDLAKPLWALLVLDRWMRRHGAVFAS